MRYFGWQGNRSAKIWSVDITARSAWHDATIRRRSSEEIMQIRNLYTSDPEGIDDTSLETNEMGTIDTAAAPVFEQLISGDRSDAVKSKLADFLAATVLRHPDRQGHHQDARQRFVYAISQSLRASNQQAFDAIINDAVGYEVPSQELILMRDKIEEVRSRVNDEDLEDELNQLYDMMGNSEGDKLVPYRDLFKDQPSHILHFLLSRCDWILAENKEAKLVLGDCAVCCEQGNWWNSGLQTVLSPSYALILRPTDKPILGISDKVIHSYEAEQINYEMAARSKRWLVAAEEEVLRVTRNQLSGEHYSLGN